MISFIICSKNNEQLEALNHNLFQLVTIPYEVLSYDNQDNKGICEVYNSLATKSKFEVLCFLHEDVRFYKNNFTKSILQKLLKPETGIIGFAGGRFKTKAPSSWFIDNYCRKNFYQLKKDGDLMLEYENPNNETFSQVVTLDGFCLFMNKKVWQENKFDDTSFSGFHFYDLDITTQVNSSYKNYVCNNVEIAHLSMGNFDKNWAQNCLIYTEKWSKTLPLAIDDIALQKKNRLEVYYHYQFIKKLISLDYNKKEVIQQIKVFLKIHLKPILALKLYAKFLLYRLIP